MKDADRHLIVGIIGMAACMILFFIEISLPKIFNNGWDALFYFATLGMAMAFGVYSYGRRPILNLRLLITIFLVTFIGALFKSLF
jgi:hypothetical protein